MKSLFFFVARSRSFLLVALVLIGLAPDGQTAAPGPALSATFNEIPAGSVVNLTSEGAIDWVHWGLFTETSLDRKNGVVPQISDFTLVDATNGFAFVYQFADNANGYSWSDGTPTATVDDTRTGVWAYGTPLIGSGFQLNAPADTAIRTLKVFVGAYGARGKFEAFLSDGSARGYTNTSLFNMRNGPSGAYAITYSAASAGQHLTIRWTLSMPAQPDGNVTLQSATLTAVNFNNPPFASITSPANNSAFSAGNDITVTAAANDTDGTVAKVEFFANDAKIGEDISGPFSIIWNNAPAGHYVLTAVVSDTQGASSISAPVEIFVNGSGGSLTGARAIPPALASAINLTSEGTRDWAQWGATTNILFNHKAGVGQQISNYQKIGAEPVQIYTDNYTSYSWTDGTPITQTNNLTHGVFTTGLENGFELSIPADTTARTLKVYVGLYGAQGNFQAWLSDYSAPAFTDTTLSNFFGNAYAAYTLNYAAAAAGATLTIRYRALNLFDQDFGNVTFQAATLNGNSGGNLPPSVTITNPLNGAIFNAPASFSLATSASDSDGSIAQVEFLLNSGSIGVDVTSPYSIPISGLAAGTHFLSAIATDNAGSKSTNNITIIVNAPPTASLTGPSNGESFVAPASITLTASADDTDGSVTNVQFFSGATLLGNDTGNPYSLLWNGVTAGTYTLTVKATDNRGAIAISAPITISVTNALPNPVTLLAPAWNGSFTFSFAAQAGRLYEVQFIDVLEGSDWHLLTNLTAAGDVLFVTNSSPTAAQRIYRVESK